MFKKFLAFLILSVSLFIVSTSQEVDAVAVSNVSGYAWSENVGWISFSTTTGNYGVNINLTSGLFSGYAWSENVGWISFEQSELTGCPSGICEARLNFGTDKVSGWARVLAASSSDSGGWDGWISLATSTGQYGVSWNSVSKDMSGWAWSGDFGWISFNCNNPELPTPRCTNPYKVTADLNAPPSATTLPVRQGDYCRASNPPIFLSWNFIDPGDSQSAYQVQTAANLGFNPTTTDSGKVTSVSTTTTPIGLAYNQYYFWRVKVWDSAGASSTWATDTTGFGTASHHYPEVKFTPSPLNPGAGEVVTFNDTSTCYLVGGGSNACKNLAGVQYKWDFTNDGSVDSTVKGNATTTYPSTGQYTASSSITDDVGTCSAARQIKVTNPLNWKEIVPF